MKNIFNTFILATILVVGVVACDDVYVEDFNSGDTKKTTLTAMPEDAPNTKVTFTDSGDKGISLEWASGDEFSVYDSNGSYVCNFKCGSEEDAKNGTFYSTKELTDGGLYTAIYPASTKSTLADARAEDLTKIQDGDEISNLNKACAMEATFSYTSSASVSMTFKHKKAVVTFIFKSEERPAKLVFDNGDNISYTVNYSTITPDDEGYYTSHVMIEPYYDTSGRTITFSLFNSDGVAYDVRSITSKVAYIEGCRYSFPLTHSDLDLDIAYTAAGIYEIYTAKGLQAFANLVNGDSDPNANWMDYTSLSGTKSTPSGNSHFSFSSDTDNTKINGKLVGDINLADICSASSGSSWTPIGKSGRKYAGTFNGDGHKVYNLYINSTLSQRALFGFTTLDGIVCNLGVDGEVTASLSDDLVQNAKDEYYMPHNYEAAGVVAYNYGTVVNCYNLATISGEINVGGVVGHNDGCVVNCYNRGKIIGTGLVESGEGKNVGGVCGQCDDTSIVGGYMLACYNTGEVSGNTYVGRALGFFNANDRTRFSKCYVLGDDATDVIIGWQKAVLDDDGNKISDAEPLYSSKWTTYTMTESEMKGADIVSYLNAMAVTCNLDSNLKFKACAWVTVEGGYPELCVTEEPSK